MVIQIRQKASVRRVASANMKRHIITLEEYGRMAEADVFGPETRIELIRGVIVDMPPPGPKHQAAVSRLHLLLGKQLWDRAIVWPQGNSLYLWDSASQPQPDVTVLRWRDDHYEHKRPSTEDVFLVIEVSESTLRYDRNRKTALYAEASIPEYWIVNLVKGHIEVHTDPSEGKYQSVRVAQRGETLELPGGFGGSIGVDEVLG